MPSPLHPFAVDVKRSRSGDDRFTWTIRRSGVLLDRSTFDYDSFEEARLDMKAALTKRIAVWKAS
jgi:hypothetical protein